MWVFRDLSLLCECYVGCSVSTGMMLRHREETVYIIGIARLGKYILTLFSVQTSNTVLKCWTVDSDLHGTDKTILSMASV